MKFKIINQSTLYLSLTLKYMTIKLEKCYFMIFTFAGLIILFLNLYPG